MYVHVKIVLLVRNIGGVFFFFYVLFGLHFRAYELGAITFLAERLDSDQN